MASKSHRQRPSLASSLFFLSVAVLLHTCTADDNSVSSSVSSTVFSSVFSSAPLDLSSKSVPVADSACGCFATNGSDAAFFARHAFYDFRNLSAFQGTPALVADARGTTNAAATSAYFTSTNFTSFWQSQNWNNSASNSSVLRINSLNNIYIEKNADANNASQTWLSLRTARQSSFQSTAEIVTQSNTYQFLSMRMLARTIGSPGGCMGMFTYRDGAADNNASDSGGGSSSSNSNNSDSGIVQEVDLEVLTKYPREHVQCTNQPSLDSDGQLIAAATQNVTLPSGLGWDDWAVYRLDWTPHQSTWYVNGQQIANISFQTPRDPTSIHINAWSDGSKWTGSMAPGTEAHLQIQWWEVLYNITGTGTGTGTGTRTASAGASCSAVCSIDVGGPPGQAVLLSTSGTDSGDSGNSGSSSGSKNGGPGGPRPMSLRGDSAGWTSCVFLVLMVSMVYAFS